MKLKGIPDKGIRRLVQAVAGTDLDAELTEVIEKAQQRGLGVFGLRKHHEVVSVGEDLPVSYNTPDDLEPEKLNGTCCIILHSYDGWDVEGIENDLEKLTQYSNDGSTILVGGTRGEDGWDPGEVIIVNAEVVYVF